MLAEDLRKSVLQAAIQGKLVEQHDSDGNVDELIEAINIERERLIKEKVIKKYKALEPITEEEIPFDIPDNWRWVRLGYITTFINYGYTASALQEDTGVKLLRITDIQNNNVLWDTVPFCNITKEKFKNYQLKENDIVIARTGGTVGKSFKIRNISHNSVYASYLIRVQLLNNINVDYIKLYLDTPFYWNQISDKAMGTGQPNVNATSLSQLLIPFPPLEEQKRIVAKVEEVMKEIDQYEVAEKELQTLKEAFPGDLKKSLLQAAIQGKLVEQHDSDGNVEELIASINSERERWIKEKIIKKTKALEPITEEEIPFDIPDNWRWIRFGDLVNFKIGKTPPRKEPVHWNGDYSWVSIADMIGDGYIKQTKESISQHGFENSFNGVFSPKGTLLMSFKLTVGKVSILDIDAIHNEAIISIFPYLNTDNIMRDYLFKTLPFLSKFGDSKGAIKGDTLNSTSLNNLLIPLPPLEEQKRIVEKLEQLLPLCDELIQA